MAALRLRPSSAMSNFHNALYRVYENEIKNYFAQAHQWKYVRSVGTGNHAGTCLFEWRPPDRAPRRYVVKFSMAPPEDAMLRREMAWLPRLRNARHVVQIVLADDLRRDGLPDPPADRPPPRRPYLILEYMPNGDVFDLRERFHHAGVPIPDEVLWSIFLCRECAAVCVRRARPSSRGRAGTRALEN